MTSVGFQTRPESECASCQDLHWRAWRSLAVPRSGMPAPAAGPDVLLHGPAGIGKTVFVRRLYRDLFDNQDVEVPILSTFAPGPFRPVAWARRFALESAQQWLGYARRDAALAGGGLPSSSALAQACRAARLGPLASLVERFAGKDESRLSASFDGVELVQAVQDELAQAAVAMGQRIVVLLDGAERAAWLERGQTLRFAQAVRPLRDLAGADEFVRRIWTWRHNPGQPHPLLPAAPVGTVLLPLEPLTDTAAEEFFRTLAHALQLDYDAQVFEGFLPLWGGVPRWLANFARSAADTPERAVLTAEAYMEAYTRDLIEGPTSQDIREALFPAGGAPIDPALLARVAESQLGIGRDAEAMPERGLGTRGGGMAAVSPPPVLAPEERDAFARLAEAGLVEYDRGEWLVARVPALRDALGLYVANHLHGERPERAATLLKRRHLLAQAGRQVARDRERRLRDVALLLESFRGQEVPAALFHAHERSEPAADTAVAPAAGATGDLHLHQNEGAQVPPGLASVPIGGQAEGLRRAAVARRVDTLSHESSILRLPHCIGVFRDAPAAGRGATASPALPTALVGWCFEHEEHLRDEETIWIAHLCEATVVTTEELEAVERNIKRLCRDLGIGRARGWLIAAGHFSPEALDRLRDMGLYTTSGEDCMALGRILLRGAAPGAAAATQPPAGARTAATVRSRVFATTPPSTTSGEQALELRLLPRAGMELIAARALEAFSGEHGFGRQAIDQMKAAILEGCLNAIERSRNAEKEVRVRLAANSERLSIAIENEGVYYDPQRAEMPGTADRSSQTYRHGWGLRLIEKFMDRVVFEPYELGTRLRMEKRIPPKVEPQAESVIAGNRWQGQGVPGA